MPARSHSSLANAIHWIDEGSAVWCWMSTFDELNKTE